MIAARSGGVSVGCLIDLMTVSQGLLIIRLAMLSKQNISASAVPSVPKKVNLYLQTHTKLVN